MISNKNSTPINRLAAISMSKGVNYECPSKINSVESRNPLPIKDLPKTNNPNFEDLTGARYGRLTVIGVYAGEQKGCRFVCRCDCGTYVTRRSKAIKNKNNTQDRCRECRHLADLKRSEVFRRTGKNVDIKEY